MRIWQWVIAVFLLLTLSANAQPSANRAASASTASASAPSTMMDQVVDRALGGGDFRYGHHVQVSDVGPYVKRDDPGHPQRHGARQIALRVLDLARHEEI